jgi:hypothetical protein
MGVTFHSKEIFPQPLRSLPEPCVGGLSHCELTARAGQLRLMAATKTAVAFSINRRGNILLGHCQSVKLLCPLCSVLQGPSCLYTARAPEGKWS